MRTAVLRPLGAAACALALAAGAAGCGGGSGGDVKSASAASATVSSLELSGFGDVLATKGGKPAYVLTSDPTDGSGCDATCLGEFKPLTADGDLTAGPGISTSDVSTFARDGGGKQVSFAGHALYTFTGEGLISGAGMKAGSGTWYLISDEGKPIKTTAAGGY